MGFVPDNIDQLKLALKSMSENWGMQTNRLDTKTKFIYLTHSYEELCAIMEQNGLSQEEKAYATHRWFNKETSEICEFLFKENGAVLASIETNMIDHTDCFIHGEPYDIKISVFPNKITYRDADNLDFRDRRDELIRWFYMNQSSGQRNCFNNRIFIVCCGDTVYERNYMKIDFPQIEMKIKTYLGYLSEGGDVHEIEVSSRDGIRHKVKSEIITIKPYATRFFEDPGNLKCPNYGANYDLKVSTRDMFRGSILCRCPKCNHYDRI